MNISLSPDLEKMVQNKINTGHYNSASEIVNEALKMMEDRDRLHEMRLAELRAEIQEGLDSGPTTPMDMEKIKVEARKQWEQNKKSVQ